MASKNVSDSALNEFFEAMSFQDDEEQTWQRYTEFLLSGIEKFALCFRSASSVPVDIRAFGSSVEKLRIISPSNIGDIDVMVFSLAEEMRINEAILEYSLPENPVFVQICGKDHPILRDCLAENSSYITASTLKDFDPKVFGRVALYFFGSLLPKMLQKLQDIQYYKVASMVEKTAGPSLQWDFTRSHESLRDHIAQMKNFRDFKMSDEVRGFTEWMVIAMNNEKPFTEDHSATVDEALTIMEQYIQKLSDNPSIENFEQTLQEMTSGEKVQELRKKVQELDKKAAEKDKDKNKDIDIERANDSPVDENTIEPFSEQTAVAEELNSDVAMQLEASGHLQKSNGNEIKGREDGDFEEGINKEMLLNQPNGCAGKKVQPKEGQEFDKLKVTVEDMIQNYITESTLKVDHPIAKWLEDLQSAADDTKQKGGMDIVPAFLAKGWPSVARAWITRDRLWPNQDVISSILDYGFHLVVKAPSESERPDVDFRLSFSHAEYVLSQELSDIQRQCYRCFKSYHLTITHAIKPKIIATYFLKTILFWTVEETGMALWNPENRGRCVMMLLGKLLKALETKFLPHFFIPEFNLLKDVVKEFPDEVESYAEEVRRVCENPMSYPNVAPEKTSPNKTVSVKPQCHPTRDAEASQSSIREVTSGLQTQEEANLPFGDGGKQANNNEPQPTTNVINVGLQPPAENSATGQYFLRFQEFQVLYREVYREMLTLALQDGSIDTEDPTVESIVSNLRQVISKIDTNPEKQMETVFECGLKMAFTSYPLHSGPDPRHRILSVLKGECEMFAYVARQDDLLATGNESLIAERMLKSSSDGNSDPFDLNVLFPLGGSFLQNVLQVIDPQFGPTQQSMNSTDDPEDIPLD